MLKKLGKKCKRTTSISSPCSAYLLSRCVPKLRELPGRIAPQRFWQIRLFLFLKIKILWENVCKIILQGESKFPTFAELKLLNQIVCISFDLVIFDFKCG